MILKTNLTDVAVTYLAIKAGIKKNNITSSSSLLNSDTIKPDQTATLINYHTVGKIDFRKNIKLDSNVYWTGGATGFETYHTNIGQFYPMSQDTDCVDIRKHDICYNVNYEYFDISEPIIYDDITCIEDSCFIEFNTRDLAPIPGTLPDLPHPNILSSPGFNYQDHTYRLSVNDINLSTAWFRYFFHHIEGYYTTVDPQNNKTIVSQPFHTKFPSRLYYGEIDGLYGLV